MEGTQGNSIVIKSELQKGQGVQDYALGVLHAIAANQSKALYVCFQIYIEGTHKQHKLRSNGKAASKTAKEAAFKNMTVGKKFPPRGS